ncbi:hypothetical protein [Noviherbaspirillum cavernae]|nr:hypothetical protein [Noviherbaspirillum cavernae]
MGLLAWDVHRLIALSRHLVAQEIPLADIREVDEAYWFDHGGPPPTCRNVIEHMRLIEAAELAYPIILSADMRVMDGMHRVAKAVLLGHSHIMAVRFEETPAPDYVDVHPDALPYDDA